MAAKTTSKPVYEFKLTRIREAGSSQRVDCPDSAVAFWRNSIATADWYQENKEQLVTLFLSTRYNLQGFNLVSMGSVNESVAHPREILGPVLCGGAYAFILMHNHPSGDPSPSEADRRLTKRLVQGAELLQVQCLDHIIVGAGENPYFSFREMGLL